MVQTHSVLFICTANICRSPMAEALLRDKIRKTATNPQLWWIESAGINAVEGSSPSHLAEEVMAEHGIDISLHKSRSVTEVMLRDFNLVLTMEKVHKQVLLAWLPDSVCKVYMLSEMVSQEFPVDDPFGNTTADYENCAAIIERIFEAGMESISRLSSSPG